MKLFAKFLETLIAPSPATQTGHFLLTLLESSLELNVVPVGNRKPVDDRDSLFLHWRDVVVDSVSFAEDSGHVPEFELAFSSFGKGSATEAEEPVSSHSAGRHKRKLYSGFANPDIQWAWAECAKLPLRYLLKCSLRYHARGPPKLVKPKRKVVLREKAADSDLIAMVESALDLVEEEAELAQEDDKQEGGVDGGDVLVGVGSGAEQLALETAFDEAWSVEQVCNLLRAIHC